MAKKPNKQIKKIEKHKPEVKKIEKPKQEVKDDGWSSKDIEYLKQYYMKKTWSELLNDLPFKQIKIREKASELGLY